jgi:prepilin-type N-terminal cleavage/methylation domain-containing protein
MKIKGQESGFTLIELLVVIAVIGVLSSIVLSSLNTARQKGADAAIKSNLANLRAQMELLYDATNSYGTITFALGNCPTVANNASSIFHNSKVVPTTLAVNSASGGTARCVLTGATPSTYVISSPLKSAGYWCIDSSGASKSHASALAGGAVACP